ncbi:TPA: HTH-type transcriptional regulator SgrR [Klebsiella pneumoniae]|nr:HTH-type transcriptional regulator SgrR [Klebsiella pneumoniae]HBQ6531270.1 HTH-type transcriptional regulator SgrR [Klebsiella pneumoniae]
MSSGRLQQQFIRLWQCCDGKSQETTLNELAEMLSCSRRHMRTLLNMMESRGWLTWEAEAGRGKRSRLTFLYTGLALQQQRAEDLLEQDRIDQLVQLVGDKAAVRQMLVSHLGRSFRQGRHILRVLYYRPMKNLLPGSALRRSETHIARQIFSALTRVNEENGELEADIAHHWQQLSPTHWRFFLRPGIHFHHGRELEMADVIASLQRSNALPLYSHIERIESPTAWTLDIHLRQPDRWLPWLLGQVPAMVLPQEWQTMNHFSSMPVGTGPYAVVRNNQNQLKIHAFEDYFGYRALIDEVNVWVLPEISEEPNGGIMRDLLAAHQVKLEIQELEYDAWHRGEVVSDIWLNSVNFTLPIEFSLFAYLYEVPLIQRCIPIDWQADACRWRAGEFNPATWSQRLLAGQHIVPLIHHWLMIQGQRSMRGVRMNTLGWFDFKSAWFAPPEP